MLKVAQRAASILVVNQHLRERGSALHVRDAVFFGQRQDRIVADVTILITVLAQRVEMDQVLND